MDSDLRFQLIDRHGTHYPAAKLNGTYQIGKGRDATPSGLAEFASAILKFGKGGRFLTPTGEKSIMGYGGKARKAVAYNLDPIVAASIGIPATGTIV